LNWTRRFRKSPAAEREPERVSRLGLVMLALTISAVGFAYAYPRLTPRVRQDFDGRIVDKYVALGESQIGSATLPRLSVETADGFRFNVAVNDEQYERAQIGMWLSRRNRELILSWDKPGPGTPGGKGTRVEAR
jgi:hypothetical protein